ncbi:MAG: hypothetical protein GX564_00960 [Oligosphaeraceae bacterium]|nr:hypothetical protein [Oligosphaeraceae bacterium]
MRLSECLPEVLSARPAFPAASQAQDWEKIAGSKRNRALFAKLIQAAEAVLPAEVPTLPASLFMEFTRNGNRSHFEKCYFQRRRQLTKLVLAECWERKGRFLDKIIDYLWDIAAEPTWCLPAHIRGHHDALPNEDVPTVDLFAAETGMTLAQVLELLGEQLSQQSQCLVEVLQRRILERVIAPVELTPFPFWWGEGRNNWTPWCCANILGAARVVLAPEPDRLRSLALRLCQFGENYLDKYPADGACNEGPSYWTVSPGIMTAFLEQLMMLGAEANNIYADARLRPMAEFIVDANLGGAWFASFSDSSGKMLPPLQFCQRLGERLQSQKLLSFTARQLARLEQEPAAGEVVSDWPLFNLLAWIFWLPAETTRAAAEEAKIAYYPVTELVFAKVPGLAFAAKGGHNRESHNHNDLGQFILMLAGEPLIVDLGAPEYSRDTFSENRFKSNIINSFGHNVPSFSGLGQCYGREFATRAVEFQEDGKSLRFTLDLAGAYPAELELQYCRRTLQLDLAAKHLLVEDDWASTRELTMQLPLISAGSASRTDQGKILLQNGPARAALTVLSQNASCQCGTFVPEDSSVQKRWQCGLNKTEFALTPAAAGTLRWEIRALEGN